jgi:release factor glutamine methyltransferase
VSDKPVAYETGICYFYNEVYDVTPDVLIPRPDTERVVDKLIELAPKNGRFLDLCTGSGCIAVSSLAARRDLTADAVDISAAAVEIAKRNAVKNGVADRVKFTAADIFNFEIHNQYDIIVSNPPYIASAEIENLDGSVKDYEPRIALDGGDDGMDFYKFIVINYKKNIKKGGYLIFEIGYDQAERIRAIGEFDVFKDYGGNNRVAVLRV